MKDMPADIQSRAGLLANKAPGEGLEGSWWLIESPDGDYTRCTPYDDLLLLVDRVKELDGEDVEVHIFYGVRAVISKGPLRYLMLPDGSKLPLFVDPDQPEADESGFLGDESLRAEFASFEPAADDGTNFDDWREYGETVEDDEADP